MDGYLNALNFVPSSDSGILGLLLHHHLHHRMLPQADHLRISLPRRRICKIAFQLSRYRCRQRLPHLNLWWQWHWIPQDSSCPPRPQTSQGHQQGKGAEESRPVFDCFRQDHQQHCDCHSASRLPICCHRCPAVQGESNVFCCSDIFTFLLSQGKFFYCTDESKNTEAECQGQFISFVEDDINKPVTVHF